MLVDNMKDLPLSLLSVGTHDLALWDVKQVQLVFSLNVGHFVDFAVVSTVRKLVICGGADSGVITAVSLTGGSIEHTLSSEEYRGMLDVAVSVESVFTATPAGDVLIQSITDGVITGNLRDPDGPSVPTRLLVSGRREEELVVGYRHGLVLVFDVDRQTVICSLPGHSGQINSLHLLPNGHLISAAEDHRAIIWNYKDQLESADDVTGMSGMWAQPEPRGWDTTEVKCDVSCYTMDSAQRLIYASLNSGDVHVWDVETSQCGWVMSRRYSSETFTLVCCCTRSSHVNIRRQASNSVAF